MLARVVGTLIAVSMLFASWQSPSAQPTEAEPAKPLELPPVVARHADR